MPFLRYLHAKMLHPKQAEVRVLVCVRLPISVCSSVVPVQYFINRMLSIKRQQQQQTVSGQMSEAIAAEELQLHCETERTERETER